jgi:succinate-semialdehyde dehydrogenase / glutarate-semialdehyde dehydrogenase
MNPYRDTDLFVDGRWRDGTQERLPVIDPATEETIGTLAHAGVADLDEALAAADRGFRTWREVGAFDRSKLMRKAAALLRERAEHVASLMTREQGKPLAEARQETLGAADTIEWFAEEARRTYGRLIPARAFCLFQ